VLVSRSPESTSTGTSGNRVPVGNGLAAARSFGQCRHESTASSCVAVQARAEKGASARELSAPRASRYAALRSAGESANDPTTFVLLLGATCWAGAYMGAFALARAHRPWDAVVFSGICLTVNVSLALTSLYFDLILFTLLALVLLTRLHIVNLMERWERNNIVPAGEMDWRILRGGLTWTLVLIMLAFFTPRVAAADLVSNAFNTFDAPYQRLQVRVPDHPPQVLPQPRHAAGVAPHGDLGTGREQGRTDRPGQRPHHPPPRGVPGLNEVHAAPSPGGTRWSRAGRS